MGRLFFAILGFSIFVALVAPSERLPSRAPQVTIVPGATAQAETLTAPVTTSSGWGNEISLNRAPSGHFATMASVNGQSLPFVVDTGADLVALTVDDARRAGIYVDPTDFTVIAEGASGPVRGKQITLDRVEVAGRTVEHVRAAVLEGLGQNLLGQSVLTQIGGVEMKGDKMVLR